MRGPRGLDKGAEGRQLKHMIRMKHGRKTKKMKAMMSVLVALVAMMTAGEAMAAGWNVTLTLKRDTIEDAMIMPSAVFIDEAGEKYYVVDSGKNRLLSFDRQGNLLHVFKAGDALESPFDMVRTDDGTIWIVEKGKNSLTRIDLKAQQTIPSKLKSAGRTVYPHRLETDGSSLFVQDKSTGDILIYDSGLNERKRIACDSCAQGFFDFKVEGSTIWALDRQGKAIYSYGTTGERKKVIKLGDEVTYPVSVAVGPSGYLYVLDRHRRDIAVFDPDGAFKYRFLQSGIASGQLYYPVEIRFDPWEGLCVTDEGNARVEVYKR